MTAQAETGGKRAKKDRKKETGSKNKCQTLFKCLVAFQVERGHTAELVLKRQYLAIATLVSHCGLEDQYLSVTCPF